MSSLKSQSLAESISKGIRKARNLSGQQAKPAFMILVGLLGAFIIMPQSVWSIGKYSPAYRETLERHKQYGIRYQGQSPVLYMTYFKDGNVKYAEECALYLPSGKHMSYTLRKQRVLWNYATQGGANFITSDMPQFKSMVQIANMPAIPSGLSPDSMSTENLLIVSQNSGGKWLTYYYDRSHLPSQIRSLLGAVEDDRPIDADSTGWTPASWPPPAV